jgi:hypothetical protein
VHRRSETGVWWASPHVAGILALVPTVVGIFLIIHELTLHDVIGGVTLQQGGVNFASAVALSKGQLPYENFVLTQPPGMSILLLPFAWAAHSNASGALTAARGFTALVAVVDIFLVGFIARFHGIASTMIAGVLFAMFPYAFFSTSTVMLEPYLLLFCLLAFHVAFRDGELAEGWRLVLAGAFVGFAVAIKPWAVIPAAALLVCAAVQWRQAFGRVLGGIVLGVGVPCITFVLASPSAFFHDVFGGELKTGSSHGASAAIGARLAEVFGFGSPLAIAHPNGLATTVALVVVIVVVLAALMRASTASMLDWALLASAIGLVVVGLIPHGLPIDYTYFLAGFGAIVIGNSIGSLLSVISSISVGAGDMSSTVAGGVTILCIAAMVTVVAVGAPKETDYWRSYFIRHGSSPAVTIDEFVPAGTCVVSNDPEALVVAKRFTDLPTDCPYLVDPGAIEKTAASPAAADAEWEQVLSRARYVVIAPGRPHLLFSPLLRRFFTRNFSLIHNADYQIYANTAKANGT